VRLLLDEHISPGVAEALRAKGYDVVAVAESTLLRGLDDEEVLRQAAADRRAVVTHNFADFLAICADWASAKREHFGVVLVSASLQRGGIGSYVEVLETTLRSHPDDTALLGRAVWTLPPAPR
jgi:predicted nuclease of predicted toxin-antitoxin system